MSEERKLYITNKWVVSIFIYYTILFFIGSFYAYKIILDLESPSVDIMGSAVKGSIAISLAAASIAYIRKLYKLCFQYSSEQENEDQLFLKRLGTIAYFVTRPIFSVIFSILIVATLRSGFLISTDKVVELDIGFVYIAMISSFYVGFLSGEFIKKLEEKGISKIKKII